MDHFNKLTPAEAERLAMLAEECGEVIHAIGKVLRHGYDDINPDRPQDGDNRERLHRELIDLAAVRLMMFIKRDIPKAQTTDDINAAYERKVRYSHHQDEDPAGRSALTQEAGR